MIDRHHIEQTVKRVIALVSGTYPPESILLSQKIQSLGIDSLDLVDMTQEIERELNIRLNDDAVRAACTVSNLVMLAVEASIEQANKMSRWFPATPDQTPTNRNFCFALSIAEAAAFLDDAKINFDQAQCAEVQKRINTLHAIAIEMAGNRGHEIYSSDTEAAAAIAMLAGHTCCAADDEPAGPGWSAVDQVAPA